MTSVLFAVMGVAPSVAWLAYYLHADSHREPRRLVLLAFTMGLVLSLPAIGLEVLVIKGTRLPVETVADFLRIGIIFWLLMAFIEEGLKLIGMKWTALHHPHFRQPIDAMMFMIVVALGFAAAENTFNAFRAIPGAPGALATAAEQTLMRGISATLLHALASAIVGYFVARSIAFDHRRRWNLVAGLLTATVLHALYNYTIILNEGVGLGTLAFVTLVILLVGTASLVSLMIHQLKQFSTFSAEHSSEHTDSITPAV